MNYALIQHKIDHGLGIAAKHLGQPFTVYRPALVNSGGDFPDGWLRLGTNVSLYRERISHSKLETGIANAVLFYDLFGDMDFYQLGDVFVCTDPAFAPGRSYGPGATIMPATNEINALCLCWHMPARIPTAGRLNRLVRIFRPSETPARLKDGSHYWKSTLDNDQPLVLQSGMFGFGAPGAPGASLVPAGLMASYRPSGAMPFGPPAPGMLRPSHWFIYLPPLFGYEPNEGDAIVTDDDARYVVVDPFKQESGIVGSQLMCDREVGQRA